AVECDRRCGKPSQRVHDPGHALGVVVAAPGEHAHTAALKPTDEAIPIVLDLMYPPRSARHGVGQGRKAGFDEARRVAGGSRKTPKHGAVPSRSPESKTSRPYGRSAVTISRRATCCDCKRIPCVRSVTYIRGDTPLRRQVTKEIRASLLLLQESKRPVATAIRTTSFSINAPNPIPTHSTAPT